MISIDYTLIIVILNFAVLLIILNKLLYKPINKFLDERKSKIEQNLDKADKMRSEAEKLVKKQEDDLKKSAEEIRKMKSTARKEAESQADEIVGQAKEHEKRIMQETEQQISHEREKTVNQIKGEMSELIASLSGKFLHGKIDPKEDKEIISDLLKE